jgi:hypothetical protein
MAMSDGLAREGFDMDLAHGEARETAFVQALQSCHVEHKSDQKVRVTGNVFVEYRQKGRPSGIATTEAEWYAIEYADDAWIVVRTSLLKALARRAPKRHGGDFNQYEGALVPITHLIRPWQVVAA